MLTETRSDADGNVVFNNVYRYDRNGNRSSSISSLSGELFYEYNERDQLMAIRGSRNASFGYDKSGNAISIQDGDQTEQLVYDVLGRVVEQRNDDGAEFTHYLGVGWKHWKTIAEDSSGASLENTYVYDGDNLLASFPDNNPALRTIFNTIDLDDNISMLLYNNDNVGHYFYATDMLSSVRAVVNSDADVMATYDYTCFGEMLNSPRKDFEQTFGFSGREYKKEFSDINCRYRNYYPAYGRFMRNDPLGYIDGPNSYVYVANRPNIARDPYGLWLSSNHTQLTNAAFAEICGPDSKSPWRQWIVDANVAVDGEGYLGFPIWDTIKWVFFGSASLELGAQHYLVAHPFTEAIEHELWNQALTESGYFDHGGVNYEQDYADAKIRYDILIANDIRINNFRKNVKDMAESRVDRLRGISLDRSSTNTQEAAIALGQALHTLQDEYSHTNAKYMPLLDTEHAMAGDSQGSNNVRYYEALDATRGFMEEFQNELCEKGVNICAE